MYKGLSVKRLSSLFSFLLLGPSVSFAANADNSTLDHQAKQTQFNTFVKTYKPVIVLTEGASIARLASSTSFAPLDLCSYHYYAANKFTTSLLLGAFLGSEILHTSNWALIAGLGYYQPAPSSNTGTLVQGPDAISSDTYRYRYNVKSQQLLAEGKLSWIIRNIYMPYLSLGLGAARNVTYGYQTTVPFYYEFTPGYANKTQTHFSYAVGVGVDFNINEAVRFGLGYRYTYLGQANLGPGQIDNIPIANSLNQSPLYANQVIAQLTLIPWK